MVFNTIRCDMNTYDVRWIGNGQAFNAGYEWLFEKHPFRRHERNGVLTLDEAILFRPSKKD